MELLLYFRSVATPFADSLLNLLTRLGGNTVVMFLAFVCYWCLDKELGRSICTLFTTSGLLCQGLKPCLHIERPFVTNPALTPCEKALSEATGYSFPSCHAASATSLSAGLALRFKKAYVWLLGLLFTLLIAFTRLYLGVHTPLDVAAGFAITVAVTLLYAILFKDWVKNPSHRNVFAFIVAILAVLSMVLCFVLTNLGITTAALTADTFKMDGAVIGFMLGMVLEERIVRFNPKAPLWVQLLKVVIGLAGILLIKAVVKLLGENNLLHALRYFLMLFFAIFVYPLLFQKAVNRFIK